MTESLVKGEDGQVDWTYYYAELVKAKADRIKWGIVGFLVGIILTITGFVVLLTYIEALP